MPLPLHQRHWPLLTLHGIADGSDASSDMEHLVLSNSISSTSSNNLQRLEKLVLGEAQYPPLFVLIFLLYFILSYFIFVYLIFLFKFSLIFKLIFISSLFLNFIYFFKFFMCLFFTVFVKFLLQWKVQERAQKFRNLQNFEGCEISQTIIFITVAKIYNCTVAERTEPFHQKKTNQHCAFFCLL